MQLHLSRIHFVGLHWWPLTQKLASKKPLKDCDFAVRSTWTSPGAILAKSKKPTHFLVEVREGNLVVSIPNGKFTATYYKPPGRPHLILRERTKTDDDELPAEAFQAVVRKARELGWIV